MPDHEPLPVLVSAALDAGRSVDADSWQPPTVVIDGEAPSHQVAVR